MRVDSFNTTSAADAADQVSKPKQESTTSTKKTGSGYETGTEDQATFSSSSPTVQALTESALETSASRVSRVASLKAAVSSGEYQLDSNKTAEALAAAEF